MKLEEISALVYDLPLSATIFQLFKTLGGIIDIDSLRIADSELQNI